VRAEGNGLRFELETWNLTLETEARSNMIGGLGLSEILVILVIFLVLFGAKKLPDIGEGLGKTVREIRKFRSEKKAGKEKNAEEKSGNLISDLKKEVEGIPGVKEARDIKETADKVKNIARILK
jgi:sec-independent protein translocase protein TatA